VSPRPLRDRPPRPFDFGEEVVQVRVRESSRARRIRVVVGPRRPPEIVVPRGVRDSEIDALLESKRLWIAQAVARAKAVAGRPARLGLGQPGLVWLAGEPLPVARRNGRRSVAAVEDGRLLVRGPDAAAPAAVERWYRREARRRIVPLVERGAARLGLEVGSVAIGDARTRWGSCSSRGTLSFSWRLLLVPHEVLEYVVVHELLHLREPNHSEAFWRLVEAARPGWREQARWLREHGQELHDYRPAAALG
jgi:predicted metal-dependent hydrolase